MESYRKYYSKKIVMLNDMVADGVTDRKYFAQEAFKETRALANLYLLSKNYLSIYSQYTERCFFDVKAFDKYREFTKMELALMVYTNGHRDEQYVFDKLKYLKRCVETEIGSDMQVTEESERHIRTINEELTQRTLFNNMLFFLDLAKDYEKGNGVASMEASTALYMATRYAVMVMARNRGIFTGDFDVSPMDSAIALAERYSIANVPEMLPSLTEIQSLMHQKAVITRSQFYKWVTEIDNYADTAVESHTDSTGCTSEFGG